MPAPAGRRATYEDVLNAPENMIAEVIHGTLHTQPRPAMPQAIARSTLLGELYGPFCRGQEGRGDWSILFSPELHLGGEPDIVVPDLAGWTRARAMNDDEARVTVAPDWVCEVLSPSTQAIDRTDEMQIYRREQVPTCG